MIISDLDYPNTIQLVRITEGYTDQGTGEWVSGSEQVTEIKGHLQEITARELRNLPEGEYELGDRRLYTSEDLEVGDVVRITEQDGSITEWIVKAVESKYSVLGKYGVKRRAYLLKAKS